jgi:two-component sensor histidine kinase
VGLAAPFGQVESGGSLGFQLVTILCRQLRADLEVSSPPGTRVRISLPRTGASA